ncbi:MAG: PqqD family protein [Spirochaetales bacterium]|nr:PqqD family protein [Spirochaetales bacterium]
MNKDAIIKANPGFSERNLGDEVVLLHESGELMHSFKESGIFLWENIKKELSFNEILATLLKEYEVDEDTALQDLTDFLKELEKQKIITIYNN